MKKAFFYACVFSAMLVIGSTMIQAQSTTKPDPMDQNMNMAGDTASLRANILQHDSAGTSVQPSAASAPMLMAMRSGWMLMLHGQAFLNLLEQSGPRGSYKLFSTNALMFMAQRDTGPGTFTFRMMNSLEPATVTNRVYPELLQVGETAFGKPIVDGQHPHDFFMELAVLYDIKIKKDALLSFYFAPVGDPAMGPTAYVHRVSASEAPLATLGHHLEDSTHIADDVVTVGVAYKKARVELSGFHSAEPDEFRWNIDAGKIDSWSSRLTFAPSARWSSQFSAAHLTGPEQLHPTEDVLRMTASVTYVRPLQRGQWASTLLWGRNHTIGSTANTNGYLAESTLNFQKHNNVWTRIENLDRTNEILYRDTSPPPGFVERPFARVQAYSFGYSREFRSVPYINSALGAQVTFYGLPAILTPVYGDHPLGGVIFLRIRLVPKYL